MIPSEYVDGWEAASQDKPDTDNPYGADDDDEAQAHIDWRNGWQAFHDGKPCP